MVLCCSKLLITITSVKMENKPQPQNLKQAETKTTKAFKIERKEAGNKTKAVCGTSGCLLTFFWIIAIGFCLTGVGLIIGIPMIIGLVATQGSLFSVLQDGDEMYFKCPVCDAEQPLPVLKPDHKEKKQDYDFKKNLKCPVCKKDLVVHNDTLTYYP